MGASEWSRESYWINSIGGIEGIWLLYFATANTIQKGGENTMEIKAIFFKISELIANIATFHKSILNITTRWYKET